MRDYVLNLIPGYLTGTNTWIQTLPLSNLLFYVTVSYAILGVYIGFFDGSQKVTFRLGLSG